MLNLENYQQVLHQMREFGIELRTGEADLKLDTPKKRTFGKGGKFWYRLYVFTTDNHRSYIVGAFGSYASGNWEKVHVDWTPLSEEERARKAAEFRAAREKAVAEKRAAALLAAMGAAELLASAKREGISPYLQRKLVNAESCRYLPDGTIVIPLMRYDLPKDERLQAVQRILPSGQKYFTKGFDKPGCCVRLGDIDPTATALLMVAEGYATGLSARMATDLEHPVFVALDAGNLAHVVPLLRKLYPVTRILILADDDWLTKDQHSGELVNPGRTAARFIARKVEGCDLVWPIFKAATREEKDTDFNDLHVREGLDAVRKQLSGVVTMMARRYG